MTYNVFGGTLNLALSIYCAISLTEAAISQTAERTPESICQRLVL